MVTAKLVATIIASALLTLATGATPSHALSDCGPATPDTAFCFIDSLGYALGNNNLGGGLRISAKYQMEALP